MIASVALVVLVATLGADEPTWTDVAPIVHRRCAVCHQSDGSGRCPIPDFGIPEDTETFQNSLEIMATALHAGRNALIHCAAGVGRTGQHYLDCIRDEYLRLSRRPSAGNPPGRP